MYKQYMVLFEWIDNGNSKETFYFDSLKALKQFCNNGGVRIEKVFKLTDITEEVVI